MPSITNLLNPRDLGTQPSGTSYENWVGGLTTNAGQNLGQSGYNFLNFANQNFQNLFGGAQAGQKANPLYELYQTGGTSNPLYQYLGQLTGIPFAQQQAQGMPQTPGQSAAAGLNAKQMMTPQGLNRMRQPGQTQAGTEAASALPNPYSVQNQGLPTGLASQQMNQEVDRLNVAKNSAIQEYRAQQRAAGRAPNPAYEARLMENFDRMSTELRTNMMQQSRQEQVNVLGSILQQGNQAYNAQSENQMAQLQALLQLAQLGAQQVSSGAGITSNQEAMMREVEARKSKGLLDQLGGFLGFAGTLAGKLIK